MRLHPAAQELHAIEEKQVFKFNISKNSFNQDIFLLKFYLKDIFLVEVLLQTP
jgi:hypothetical protein